MIRKHKNRRMYCTEARGWIVLAQVQDRIRRGETPRIVSVPDRLDVTTEVYAAILLEMVKEGSPGFCAGDLIPLIRMRS